MSSDRVSLLVGGGVDVSHAMVMVFCLVLYTSLTLDFEDLLRLSVNHSLSLSVDGDSYPECPTILSQCRIDSIMEGACVIHKKAETRQLSFAEESVKMILDKLLGW